MNYDSMTLDLTGCFGFPQFVWRETIPEIKDVIFHAPATIIKWKDGTKTVVKCGENEEYSKEFGFALCICKKAMGNKGNFNEVFKKWVWNED